MVSAIAKSLNFSSTEFRYFDLLVRRDHLLRISHDTSVLDREIKDILVKTPNHSEPELTLDDRTFSMIAKWYHLPIKQLVSTRSFKPSLDWIRKRLRNKLSNYQVREALENLVAVGVIQKDQERGYIPSIAVKQPVVAIHNLT